MGEIADRLDQLTVRVVSPDNRIKATLFQRTNVEVEFRPGTYERYDEEGLGHQLSRLATLLWTGWQRGYAETMAKSGMAVQTRQTATDHADREFQEGRFQFEALGEAADKRIRVATRGLREWKVRIRPGTLETMDEVEFIEEALTALAKAIGDHNMRLERWKREVYDDPMPKGITG